MSEVELIVKQPFGRNLCNGEYSKKLIKGCKFGKWIDGVMYCECRKDCNTCVIGSGRGAIPMHPEQYKKVQEMRSTLMVGRMVKDDE